MVCFQLDPFIFLLLSTKIFGMKKYLIAALFMSLGICSFSQEHDLSSLYSNEQLAELRSNNPEVIDFWNIFLDKGWAIDVIKSDQKLNKTIELKQGTSDDITKNLNLLEHSIFPAEGTQYVGIQNSDLVIIVYPRSHVIYHYNKAKTK